MQAIIAIIMAALPKAIMAIAAKLFSDAFVQKILEKIVISGLKYLVTLSTNKIDDGIVADIEKRLTEPA